MFLSTPNFLLEIKSVPDVPREILQPPSPTVAVPTAAAALSPAPAITFTSSDTPSSAAISAFKVPTTSQLSYSFGSCASVIPQISSISADQHLCSTSKSSIPEASEYSVQKEPDKRYAR